MPLLNQTSNKAYIEKRDSEDDPKQLSQIRERVFMKIANMSRLLILLLLVATPLSCGGGSTIENQANTFFTSLHNLDIDKCVEMSLLFQTKLASIQNEPQFKIDKLANEISNDVRRTILNQYDNDNIVYVFKFPCQWKILETKELSQETPNNAFSTTSSFYRVFVVINYNSSKESPASTPLITKVSNSQYNIKEIVLHCDFDPETKSYMGWGLDSHTRW
jgi:hypothetical protein